MLFTLLSESFSSFYKLRFLRFFQKVTLTLLNYASYASSKELLFLSSTLTLPVINYALTLLLENYSSCYHLCFLRFFQRVTLPVINYASYASSRELILMSSTMLLTLLPESYSSLNKLRFLRFFQRVTLPVINYASYASS